MNVPPTPEDPLLYCPRCRGLMHKRLAHGVHIDVCGRCAGVWFDDGELERAANVHTSSLIERRAMPDAALPCPRCREGLRVAGDGVLLCATHGLFVPGAVVDARGIRAALGDAGVAIEEPDGRVVVIPPLPYGELSELWSPFVKLVRELLRVAVGH